MVSAPVVAQEAAPYSQEALVEEIIVTGHRSGTPQARAIREQVEFALRELLDSIERDEAQRASERITRSPIRFGYDAKRDTGPLIDAERERVAMSFVRPASVLSIGF
jgi:hypothetical protein